MTKVFTAAVLADMAERGEVHLSDPAASYLPGRAPPGQVTLADLATHTAGLPRLPRGLFPSALLHPADPYARYPAARLVRDARRALRAGSPALEPAIRATFTPRRPIPGGEIGLAWHHARRGDRTIAWHNGMTGGFSAMVALDLTRGLGVAALANTAGAPPSPLDRAVLSAFGS